MFRRSTSTRWKRASASAALVAVLMAAASAFVVASAAPAGATITGPCKGSGSFEKGTKAKGPFTATAETTGTITVPLKDKVDWQGSISGVSGRRPVSGAVELELPWPWGSVTIEKWGNDGKLAEAVENKGIES